MPSRYTIRRATGDDVGELLRLRQVMFTDVFGERLAASPGPDGAPEWHASSRAFLLDGFADGSVAAFVAETHADGRLVGGGVGDIRRRLSGPHHPGGRVGSIASMATEPGWRGQGIGTAVVEALLGWFVAEGVQSVELQATPAGEPVYRALGFVDSRFPRLRWSPDGPLPA